MVPRIPVVACFCEMHVSGMMSEVLLTASYQSKKCQVYGSRRYDCPNFIAIGSGFESSEPHSLNSSHGGGGIGKGI